MDQIETDRQVDGNRQTNKQTKTDLNRRILETEDKKKEEKKDLTLTNTNGLSSKSLPSHKKTAQRQMDFDKHGQKDNPTN